MEVPYVEIDRKKIYLSWVDRDQTDYLTIRDQKRVSLPIKWETAHLFFAELEIGDESRGRSSRTVAMTDVDRGHEYSMFFSGFVDMTKTATVNRGKVLGWWKHVKQGTNYAIRYADAPQLATPGPTIAP